MLSDICSKNVRMKGHFVVPLQRSNQVQHCKFSCVIDLMSTMNSLKGIFDTQKPPKRNFILENMKQLRTMRKLSESGVHEGTQRKKSNLYPHVTAKVSTHFSPNSLLNLKGSSSIEQADQSKQNNSPNQTLTGRGMLNKQHQSIRSQHSDKNGYFKPSATPKSQENRGSISNIYMRETPGQNKANICEMTTDVPSMSHIRSASILDGSTSHIAQERLPFVVSENQAYNLPVRSLGCQTIPSDDIDRILNEGVIKYPSTCNMDTLVSNQNTLKKSKRPTTCDSGLQTEISVEKNTPNLYQDSTSPKRIVPSSVKASVCQHSQKFFSSNFEKENSKEQINAKSRVVTDKNFSQGHWYGGMSRSRKCQDSGVPQNAFTGLQENVGGDSSTCPIGHVSLPETERVETLKILHKSYEEYIKELNLLPVRTDTLKMRQRKIDLEKQLNKLEEGIKVFSRPRVYMKIGI